ncbi:hypothetical protein [Massilia rhizosphaerae]|uniref:hypothetical protein n=1 Tax=Massilia rhizosphaerae TaxID=2784389 RepID=UPI0018DB6E8E|nr:hypothetical protein [Massilia rhizosphaerae]
MQINEVLSLVTFGAIGGMFGQGLRVVVGLKKAQEQAVANGLSFQDDVFDSRRLWSSLLIGAIAGGIGVFTLNTLPTFKDGTEATNMFFALVGIGYAGTDFIEGFINRYLPLEDSSGRNANKTPEPPPADPRAPAAAAPAGNQAPAAALLQAGAIPAPGQVATPGDCRFPARASSVLAGDFLRWCRNGRRHRAAGRGGCCSEHAVA